MTDTTERDARHVVRLEANALGRGRHGLRVHNDHAERMVVATVTWRWTRAGGEAEERSREVTLAAGEGVEVTTVFGRGELSNEQVRAATFV